MFEYEKPCFSYKAPLELAIRRDDSEIQNQQYRTSFMRDRDRVMYCSAFRRLSGKTQIYLTGKDDHRRNRLTHTLEVSQIARTVSRALKLDCDLTEAIALAHDLGHTPFGHAGEQILHEIMVPGSRISIKNSPMNELSPEIRMPMFGFKHNVQSLRVAASLENNYGNSGLNLTNFTLWGILHHSSLEYNKEKVETAFTNPDYKEQYRNVISLKDGSDKEAWSFEAFVVAQSDEIAQWHHDLEDALRGNAMTSSEVCEILYDNLQSIMTEDDINRLNKLREQLQIDRKYITDLSRIVVNTLVNRLIECSLHNLKTLYNKGDNSTMPEHIFEEHCWNEDEIKNAIGFSKYGEDDNQIKKIQKEYPSVISKKIHHSRDVERMNAKGQYIIKKLFQAYYSHPQQLPDNIIRQYMIDVKQYENLEETVKAGVGTVRMKFAKLFTNATTEQKIMLMRKICDHIAGMTDHFAMEEYEKLYG